MRRSPWQGKPHSSRHPLQEHDHLLRSFLAIARAGTLRQAAENLDISQPALSKQLRRLEQTLGQALFRRHGRGMAPTAAGQSLFAQLSHGFELIDQAVDQIRNTAAGTTGSVSICTVNTLGAYMVPDLLARLAADQPGLRASVHNASSPGVVERVERGYADIGLVYDISVNTNAVLAQRLHRETIAGYCMPEFSPCNAFSAGELVATRLILPPRPYALRSIVEREIPASFVPAIESNSVSMSLDFAAKGLGLALLPHLLPDELVSTRGLKRVSILDGKLHRPVAAIYRNGSQLNAPTRAALAAAQLLAQRFQSAA